MPSELTPKNLGSSNKFLLLLKLILLAGLVGLTNPGAGDEVLRLLAVKQFVTLIPFVIIWSAALAGILVAALHPKLFWRFTWGLVISFATAISMGYYWMSHTQLSIFDLLAGWNASHEAGRALDFYASDVTMAIGLFVFSYLIFVLPISKSKKPHSKVWNWLATVPSLPIAMIATVIFIKNGSIYGTMPNQFAPVSIGSLFAGKLLYQKPPVRGDVSWDPQQTSNRQNIVYLVDESIRADYIDLTPDNPFTPKFAKLANEFVNFGPASSAGNCSNYSNALLRFGASRENLALSVNTNPTLFDYAKHAGYRTVFIDGQAQALVLGNKYQNFMTLKEVASIDDVYLLHDVKTENADEELGKIIAKELKQGGPVFIYANKNGSHFPYDHSYPVSEAKFHPIMRESSTDTQEARINSFRNGIAWSVDRFMEMLFAETDFANTTMVYTSDHGQEFDPGHLTHCQAENPNPKMHIVPLMVHTTDPILRKRFEDGAQLLRGKASHFQIAPTLYELMGYQPSDIATRYDESLFIGSNRAPETTSGDVFEFFRIGQNWNPVDLTKNYMEIPRAASVTDILKKTVQGG